jgi:hypothetical protein
MDHLDSNNWFLRNLREMNNLFWFSREELENQNEKLFIYDNLRRKQPRQQPVHHELTSHRYQV